MNPTVRAKVGFDSGIQLGMPYQATRPIAPIATTAKTVVAMVHIRGELNRGRVNRGAWSKLGWSLAGRLPGR